MVEAEYRRMLGARKVIWVPTGIIEDNGTYRGALGKHIRVPSFDGVDIPHAGVYTLFTTNGHIDEPWLSDLERRNNVFPNIDYGVYA